VLARPLLTISKSRLVATLNKAKIAFADDPTNRDTAFTRPRLRALLPLLAAEGGDARGLARLASRLARANTAVEVLVDGAERYLAMKDQAMRRGPDAAGLGLKASGTKDLVARDFDAEAFAGMPEEIRLRLLMRAINQCGHEGPAELGKVEALLAQLDRGFTGNSAKRTHKTAQTVLKQTLAGALVSVARGRIRVEPAPVRRGRTAALGRAARSEKEPARSPKVNAGINREGAFKRQIDAAARS
jgi:tRNA(Ile)-lysidine synthase